MNARRNFTNLLIANLVSACTSLRSFVSRTTTDMKEHDLQMLFIQVILQKYLFDLNLQTITLYSLVYNQNVTILHRKSTLFMKCKLPDSADVQFYAEQQVCNVT